MTWNNETYLKLDYLDEYIFKYLLFLKYTNLINLNHYFPAILIYDFNKPNAINNNEIKIIFQIFQKV